MTKNNLFIWFFKPISTSSLGKLLLPTQPMGMTLIVHLHSLAFKAETSLQLTFKCSGRLFKFKVYQIPLVLGSLFHFPPCVYTAAKTNKIIIQKFGQISSSLFTKLFSNTFVQIFWHGYLNGCWLYLACVLVNSTSHRYELFEINYL